MKHTPAKQKQIDNFYFLLQELKDNCDNGQFIPKSGNSLTNFFVSHHIAPYYGTVMVQLGVLYKDENKVYRWKSNIPVSKNLCVTIFNACGMRRGYNTSAPRLKVNPNIKQVIDKRKNNGGKSTKTNGVDMRKKEYRDIPKVGLIRTFLRWIY